MRSVFEEMTHRQRQREVLGAAKFLHLWPTTHCLVWKMQPTMNCPVWMIVVQRVCASAWFLGMPPRLIPFGVFRVGWLTSSQVSCVCIDNRCFHFEFNVSNTHT